MANPDWWIRTDELSTGRVGTPRAVLDPRNYIRRFRVLVNDKSVGPIEVTGAPGLPYLWSFYISFRSGEYDQGSLCIRLTAEQEDNGEGEFIAWVVTADYSTDIGLSGPQQPNPGNPNNPENSNNNPELELPEIEWGGETMQRAFQHDLDKKPYANSAGLPFKPAVAVERGFRTLTYTRNEISHNTQRAEEYSYALNSDTFFGYAPGKAQCLPPVARGQYKGGFGYFRVTYKFRFFPKLPQVRIKRAAGAGVLLDEFDWQPHVLDAGRMIIVDDPIFGKIQVPVKRGAQNVPDDVQFDGAGKPVVLNAQGDYDPTFIKFRAYESKPFAALFIRL